MNTCGFSRRPCPACGADATEPEVASSRPAEDLSFEALRPYWSGLFKEKAFFSYERCRICGLLFAPTYFNAAQLADLYSKMAPNMEVVPPAALEATQRGYFDAVKAARLTGGYLEIGPDIGLLVSRAASDRRFDHFWLFEPNADVHWRLREAAAGRPHTIAGDMDDLSPAPDGSVALAVLVHVMDHLLNPMATLRQVRRKLKPGGVAVIVTHNEASILRRVMGEAWPPFCLQHPELYSPSSMTEILRRAGFQSISVSRSRNYFPISFMARQAAWRFRIDISRLPLPDTVLGLRLGNMITVAEGEVARPDRPSRLAIAPAHARP